MLKMTITNRHLDAATELISSGCFFFEEGESLYSIEWDPRVQLISFTRIPGSKNRLVTLRMVGVSIRDTRTNQPVFGLYRQNCVLTAYDDEGNSIMSLPVIDLRCVNDSYVATPRSEEK